MILFNLISSKNKYKTRNEKKIWYVKTLLFRLAFMKNINSFYPARGVYRVKLSPLKQYLTNPYKYVCVRTKVVSVRNKGTPVV